MTVMCLTWWWLWFDCKIWFEVTGGKTSTAPHLCFLDCTPIVRPFLAPTHHHVHYAAVQHMLEGNTNQYISWKVFDGVPYLDVCHATGCLETTLAAAVSLSLHLFYNALGSGLESGAKNSFSFNKSSRESRTTRVSNAGGELLHNLRRNSP